MGDPLRVLGLFEGIGGIALGLDRSGGFKHTQFCEIDPYCQKVLAKHWPEVPCHPDVRTLEAGEGEYDIITAGFPCQPVSNAGQRLGKEDPRWLWPEVARLIGSVRPRYVLLENVRGLCSKGLPEVLADLTRLGYDAEWQIVSAASVGAPHLRERVVILAYPEIERLQWGRRPWTCEALLESEGCGEERGRYWATEPRPIGVAYGVPSRLDRLRVLGNSVVPQVAEFVGTLIREADERGTDRTVDETP